MKNLTCGVAVLISALAAAEPSVSRVLVRQQWPWERVVRVDYELQGADVPMDVDISVETESGTVYGRDQLLAARTEGELFGIENGLHSFTFKAPQREIKPLSSSPSSSRDTKIIPEDWAYMTLLIP